MGWAAMAGAVLATCLLHLSSRWAQRYVRAQEKAGRRPKKLAGIAKPAAGAAPAGAATQVGAALQVRSSVALEPAEVVPLALAC